MATYRPQKQKIQVLRSSRKVPDGFARLQRNLEFLDTSRGYESHRGAEFWHRNKNIIAGIRKIFRDPETVENVTQTLTPAICVTSVDFMGFY